MPHKLMRRDERKQRIKDIFVMVGQGRKLTVFDVAKLADLTPSGWLRQILNELFEAGFLDAEVVPHRANTNKTVYWLK